MESLCGSASVRTIEKCMETFSRLLLCAVPAPATRLTRKGERERDAPARDTTHHIRGRQPTLRAEVVVPSVRDLADSAGPAREYSFLFLQHILWPASYPHSSISWRPRIDRDSMMREICAVSPSVVVKVACLMVVYLAPSVIGASELRNHQQAGIGAAAALAADQRAHRHRYLREPASPPASSVADINVPSPPIQRERRESSTVCAECDHAATTRAAGPSNGNGQAATNNYERSDEKQGATASGAEPQQENMGQDEDENDNGSPTGSYFEPTLQPTVEADNPDASTYWTQTKEDEHKVAESLEEEIDCPWCHDDELDRGPDGPSSGDGGFPDKSFPDDPYDYPKASPDSYRDNNQSYGSDADHRLIDDMVAPFFLLAAVLLILALVYTLLFLCVVRLGTIRIDEDRYPRGRVYFCGSFCFVPLCWFYRLYAADPSGAVGIASTSDARVMGLRREERKEAVTELLKQYSATVGEDGDDGQMNNSGVASHSDDNIASNISSTETSASPTETEAVTTMTPSSRENTGDTNLMDADENQCSICLDGYGKWAVNDVLHWKAF